MTIMWIRDDLAAAIARCGVAATMLSGRDATQLEERLAARYARTGTEPLWERLDTDAAWSSPEGWRLAGQFDKGPVVLLVRDAQGVCALRLERAEDLEALLAECSGFAFVLTDDDGSYVLAFNDHDVLIGAGRAREWVEQFAGDQKR